MLQIGDNFVILAIEGNEEGVDFMPYNVKKDHFHDMYTFCVKTRTCKNSFILIFKNITYS